MAINPNLLIAAPMLQDYFVDNATGTAMAAGIITCYQDNSRTTLKNWYYQSGTPGNYTYIPLPNPLTLSAVGTIVDVNGNDTIPFFYPYSELDQNVIQPYYITVVDSNGQTQFTRQNFPFLPSSGTLPVNQIPTLNNIISNNVFYHNIGSANLTNVTNMIIAPSQHDGFIAAKFSEWRFIKSTTGATDTVTFTAFGSGNSPLMNDITPEYYVNLSCTATQAGETLKVFRVPLSLHIKTLESVQATLTIQAQNVGTNNILDLNVFQFLGSGSSGSADFPIGTGSITLSNSWQKYSIPFIFPSTIGTSISNAGDDGLYLDIGFPLSSLFNINIAKPSIYLSVEVPTNDFETYDQIDTIINSPRTGDVRMAVNNYYPYGWIAANNGTIGNSSSNATSRANQDTWQLFSMLWHLAQPYDSGSNSNPICQMVTSAGSNTNYGASDYADFNANNAITLTKTFGQVLIGSVPTVALLSNYTKTITASNAGGNLLITVSSITGFYNYQPIVFTTTGTFPGNIIANAVYFISNISGNTFNVSTSFANSISGTYVSWSSAGSNSSVIGNVPGMNFGEYAHAQSVSELATHNHAGLAGAAFGVSGTSSPNEGTTAISINTNMKFVTTTDNAGSRNPFNIIQPSTFYNVFLKL